MEEEEVAFSLSLSWFSLPADRKNVRQGIAENTTTEAIFGWGLGVGEDGRKWMLRRPTADALSGSFVIWEKIGGGCGGGTDALTSPLGMKQQGRRRPKACIADKTQ